MPITQNHGISVLMPVRNAGAYLQAAVDSILNQTHRYLELLLIDDHSTDQAIDNLVGDKRLQVLTTPDRGIVSALNLGLSKSTLPYIARMDADDIAHPKRLEIQLAFLLSNPTIDIVGAKVELFKDNRPIADGYAHYEKWINQQCTPQQIQRNFFIESCIPHPTALMHRNVLTHLNGYQDTPWPEDYDLWCRAYLEGFQFGKPNSPPLLRWRDHDSRASRVQRRYAKQQFLRCKANYLSQWLAQRGKTECMIWGTGPTGLKLHDYLEAGGISVSGFIDINPQLAERKKRGKPVTVVSMTPTRQELKSLAPFGVIAVSARGARDKIRKVLCSARLIELESFVIV